MSENLSKTPEREKLFELSRRDGSKAIFRFDKEDNVWYLNIPHKGKGASIPLPDLNFDNCQTLKDCLDLMAKSFRGEKWVAQVYMDIMYEGA